MRARPAETKPYNSALKGAIWPGRELLIDTSFAETSRGMVFAYNVCEPMHPELIAHIGLRSQCLYCEIPWPAAGETFYRRAGVTPEAHAVYVAAVKAILERFQKPAFIVGSKRDAVALSDQAIRLVGLNGRPAWLAISRTKAPVPEARTTGELLAHLASVYGAVYDFGCGYGASLRPFAYFIGSDIDRKCLAYVAREIL
jgi:hypothetical protein